MTQNASDVEIANQGFAAFRQDLNDVLEDITTLHSGNTAPTTTYANQWWYELDTNKLYIRNEDNDAWIEILTLDQANDHLASLGASITLDSAGAVTLQYNGSAKLATTNTGIDVTGTVTADGLTVDSGSANEVATFSSTDAGAFLYIQDDNSLGYYHGSSSGSYVIRDTDNKNRINIASNGDISFYEDTGTNVRWQWDASNEAVYVGVDEWPTSFIGKSANRHGITPNGSPVLMLWDASNGAEGNNSQLWLGGKPTNSATNFAGGRIQGEVENSSDEDGFLAFSTSLAGSGMQERMRIDSSGNVLVGTTSTSASVAGGRIFSTGRLVTSVDGEGHYFRRNTSNGSIVGFAKDGATVGSISVTASSTAYNTSSDYRLKENVTGITDGIERVKQLNPSRFNFIADAEKTVDGFIAHEAQTVVPEAVHGEKDAMRDEEYEVTPAVYEDVVVPAVLDDDGNEIEAERTEQQLVTEAVMGTRSVPDYQGIDQAKLVPLLTAALQEAIAKIEDLETRVAALEN